MKRSLLFCALVLLLVNLLASSQTASALYDYREQKASAASQPAVPAEILWDKWGTPHIFARDFESAFRAFGWAQMESHGNLLLKLYAKARGRAAEYFGSDFIQSDRAVRIMGLYEIAKNWYAAQSPAFRRYLDSFAEGINQYAKQNQSKLSAESREVLPITATDVMAHSARVIYLFLGGVSGIPGVLPSNTELGSNGWAIAPSHAASGHALLLVNPHLAWANESLFYESHIVAPDYNAYGGTLVGFPGIGIGFNDYLGWTHTVNTIDPGDLFELTLEKGGYKYDGQVRAFETETQTMKVKQSDGKVTEEKLTIRRSVHGPVVERAGKAYAIRIAGLQASSYSGMLEQWFDMSRAKNFREFQSALRRAQLPMFNVIYGDRAGHIMLLFGGQVPVRAKGDASFWARPVAGDTSELLWTKVHSYDDLPKAIDPPAGWVQNSNDVPWHMTEPMLNPDKYPAYMSPRLSLLGALFREQRGIRMIKGDPKISLDELVAYKYSTRCELADRILDNVLAAVNAYGNSQARRAAEVLRAWDREMNSDSRGAVLFALWYFVMARGGDIFHEPFDPKRPLDTPLGLRDPKAAADALDAAATQIQNSYGKIDVTWGEACRFRRGKVDAPANGGPGQLGIFRAISIRPNRELRFEATGGDSFIAAVEFSTPVKAKVLMTYGNSSNPDSAHYGDQLELSSRKQLRDAWRTRAEIEANLESRTIFNSDGIVTSGGKP